MAAMADPVSVAFISADFQAHPEADGSHLPGGAGWYRCALPAAALAANGHRVVHRAALAVLHGTGEICPVGWDNTIDYSGYDVIVVQRWMRAEAADIFRRARACGQVVVSDIDDWFEGIATSNEGSRYLHADPNVNLGHYRRALAASSAVTASTPYLADRVRGRTAGTPVHVIRNAIDLDRWPAQADGFRARNDRLIIGWVGATPWRSGDLETIGGVLSDFLDESGALFAHGGYVEPHPAVDCIRKDGQLLPLAADVDPQVRVMWANQLVHVPARRTAPDLLGLRPDQVAWEADMAPITCYPNLWAGIDVALVPLRDTPFNLSKSAIKGMEAAAQMVPFLAADTPEYRWFGAGAVCRRPRDWTRTLRRLVDPEARAAAAEVARERVAAEDITLRWKDWADLYAGLRP